MYYVCDKQKIITKNGRCKKFSVQFGVMNTKNNLVHHYTKKQILSFNNFNPLGFKETEVCIIDIDEWQKINWGDFTVFSFYNKNDDKIYIGVENKRAEIVYLKKISPFIEKGMISYSQFRNGDLEVIFDEGKVNKCIGICLYLEYGYSKEDNCTPRCCEIYLEYLPDKDIIDEYCYYPWNFNETGCEPIYSKEEDRIIMSDYKTGGYKF